MVPSENIKITVAPKGFGSENMSKSIYVKTCRWNRRRKRCSN
ncbi:MAG: fumarate hydratase [Eubacterium sp.]